MLPAERIAFAEKRQNVVADLMNQIIRPLQAQEGLEAFRDLITTTESQVLSGLLHSPREVEVTLTAKVSKKLGCLLFGHADYF